MVRVGASSEGRSDQTTPVLKALIVGAALGTASDRSREVLGELTVLISSLLLIPRGVVAAVTALETA